MLKFRHRKNIHCFCFFIEQHDGPYDCFRSRLHQVTLCAAIAPRHQRVSTEQGSEDFSALINIFFTNILLFVQRGETAHDMATNEHTRTLLQQHSKFAKFHSILTFVYLW